MDAAHRPALLTGPTVAAAIVVPVLLDHMDWIGFKEYRAAVLRPYGTEG